MLADPQVCFLHVFGDDKTLGVLKDMAFTPNGAVLEQADRSGIEPIACTCLVAPDTHLNESESHHVERLSHVALLGFEEGSSSPNSPKPHLLHRSLVVFR